MYSFIHLLERHDSQTCAPIGTGGGGGGGYSDILMKLCFLVILSLGKRDTCFKMSKARLFKDLKNVSIDYNKK